MPGMVRRAKNMITVISNSMANWKMVWTSGGTDLGQVTLDQRFPYKESEERDPLVTRSEAFQMIGPIKLSHSTGGIWV